MNDLWPWLAVAGMGALHGLNPATGWIFAAAWSLQSGKRAALRALVPIVVGHSISVTLLAPAVTGGLPTNGKVLQIFAGTLLVGLTVYHLLWHQTKRTRMMSGHVGIALWSFIMSTAHGAGLMLVPALIPFCIGNAPAREITASGSLTLSFAAIGIHTAAMLVVTAVVASGACRGYDAGIRLLQSLKQKPSVLSSK